MNRKTLVTLFAFGRPLGPLYAQVMKARAWLFRKSLIKQQRMAVPVISVGNLTMGGSGKTPLTIYLARLLQSHGYKPAVVSRGYHGTGKERVNVVSDGHQVYLDSRTSGDEPHLIATKVPGVIVLTGRKRVFPCHSAIENFGCNIIILDDGFQHLGVRRDIDLVLFDIDFFAGNSRVFPGGDLREPVSSLNRCDAFVLTGLTAHNKQRAEKCSALLEKKFIDKPVFMLNRVVNDALLHPSGQNISSAAPLPIQQIPHPLFVFSGIAQPERFIQSLEDQKTDICGVQVFPDHYRYRDEDLEDLAAKAIASGAQGMLTTEKDYAKIRDRYRGNLPLAAAVLTIVPNREFDGFILDRLSRKS